MFQHAVQLLSKYVLQISVIYFTIYYRFYRRSTHRATSLYDAIEGFSPIHAGECNIDSKNTKQENDVLLEKVNI